MGCCTSAAVPQLGRTAKKTRSSGCDSAGIRTSLIRNSQRNDNVRYLNGTENTIARKSRSKEGIKNDEKELLNLQEGKRQRGEKGLVFNRHTAWPTRLKKDQDSLDRSC